MRQFPATIKKIDFLSVHMHKNICFMVYNLYYDLDCIQYILNIITLEIIYIIS